MRDWRRTVSLSEIWYILKIGKWGSWKLGDQKNLHKIKRLFFKARVRLNNLSPEGNSGKCINHRKMRKKWNKFTCFDNMFWIISLSFLVCCFEERNDSYITSQALEDEYYTNTFRYETFRSSNYRTTGGSIPTLSTKDWWTDSWRGGSLPPCHGRGVPEQGTVPPCSLGPVNGCLPLQCMASVSVSVWPCACVSGVYYPVHDNKSDLNLNLSNQMLKWL